MNPIALSSPDGIAYAYACSQCHNITHYSKYKQAPDERSLELAKKGAENCCICSRCRNAPVCDEEWCCEQCKSIAETESEVAMARYKIENEKRNEAIQGSLKKAKNVDSATLLRNTMSDISENLYCAGWLVNLEYTLWDIVNGGDRSFGMGELNDAEVNNLKSLSENASGWWRWDDEIKGELFVASNEWQEIYSKHKPDTDDKELSEEEFDDLFI